MTQILIYVESGPHVQTQKLVLRALIVYLHSEEVIIPGLLLSVFPNFPHAEMRAQMFLFLLNGKIALQEYVR